MSKVYFLKIKNQSPEALIEAGRKISAVSSDFFSNEDKVAVKLHFGERGNKNHVSPIFVKEICNNLKGKVKDICLTDCNGLYKGERTLA